MIYEHKPNIPFYTFLVLKVPDDVMEGQEFDQSVYYVCPDFHSLYISLVVTIYLNDYWKWRLTPISITPYPISLFNVSKMRDTRYMKTQDSLLWQESLNLYSTHINKTNIKHKETMTFDVGNPAPGLGQAQKCGSVILLNGIPTLLLITGSPMAIHIFKQMINKIMHRLASTQKDHILLQKYMRT